MLKKKFGVREFKSPEEIKSFWVKGMKKKIKYAYKTPYWREKFDELLKGRSLDDFLKEIKTVDDFGKIPETFREDLKYSDKMVVGDLSNYILMSTGGTTSDPAKVYFHPMDNAVIGLIFAQTYENMGVSQFGDAIMFFPKSSPVNRATSLRKVLPNLKFIPFGEEAISPETIERLLKADVVTSYTHVFPQLVNENRELIDKLKREGKVNIKLIISAGDFMPQRNVRMLKDILGNDINVANIVIANDAPGISYSCEKGNIHLASWAYIAELKPHKESGSSELVITSLFGKGSQLIRYHIGDLAEINYDCPCGSADPVIKLVGRTYEGEVHKHCSVQLLQNACASSKAFENGKLSFKGGMIVDYCDPASIVPVYHYYFVQGRNFKQGDEEEIVRELSSYIRKELKPYLGQGINNWADKYHIVKELPEELRSMPGKWKIRKTICDKNE